MNSISIIGCGWLGLPLAENFVAKAWQVKGSTRTAEKMPLLQQKNISPFLFDIHSPKAGDLECLQSNILFINIPPGRKNPQAAKNYPAGIERMLAALTSDQKVIFVSSTSVYGGQTGVITEADERLANTVSGKALVEAEQLLIKALGDRLCILRPSGLVGPNRHPVNYLAGRQQLPNGDAPVNLIHKSDVLQIIEAIIEQERWGEAFNLAADEHPSKAAYYGWAAERLGLEAPSFLKGGGVGKKIDGGKAKRMLGLELSYPDPKDFIQKK